MVCFLSSDPVTRAYEVDLVRELNRKKLGVRKVIVGPDVPADIVTAEDVVIDSPGLASVADDGRRRPRRARGPARSRSSGACTSGCAPMHLPTTE